MFKNKDTNSPLRFAGTIILLTISIFISLLVVEFLLRVYRPNTRQSFQVAGYKESERAKFCTYDPILGWKGKPNIEDTFTYIDSTNHVSQNRYGFRGKGYDFKRSTTKRMVVLGDSFVWGFGVEEQEMFTTLLERENRPQVEVVNLGVSGYGNDQELLMWQNLGKKFHPDEVILAVTPYNDIWENITDNAYGYPKPFFSFSQGGYTIQNQPVPDLKRGDQGTGREEVHSPGQHQLGLLAQKSALISSTILALARNGAIRNFFENQKIIPQQVNWLPSPPFLYLESTQPQQIPYWPVLLRLLEIIHEEITKTGTKLTILIVPSVAQVYDEQWTFFVEQNRLPAGTHWNRNLPNQIIANFCKAKGIQFIDPLTSLKKEAASDPFLYFTWNKHWTPAGHRVVANLMLRELSSTTH